MQLPQFKIRCSAIGKIMTNGRGKDTIGQTALSYLEKWVKSKLYSREQDVYSKYLSKGIQIESDIIKIAAGHYGWGDVVKNEQFYEDEFLTGTPDIVLEGKGVVDMKGSWDCFTFPLFDEDADKDYWYQLQGYMALTGLKNAALVYVLHDAPTEIIEREAWHYVRAQGDDELTEEIFEEFKAKMTYSHLPIELRVKRYNIKRDDEAIEAIRERVELCRTIIAERYESK